MSQAPFIFSLFSKSSRHHYMLICLKMFPVEYAAKGQYIYRQGACATVNVLLCSMAFVDVLCSISSVSDSLSLPAVFAASVTCERAQHHAEEDMDNGEEMHVPCSHSCIMVSLKHSCCTFQSIVQCLNLCMLYRYGLY